MARKVVVEPVDDIDGTVFGKAVVQVVTFTPATLWGPRPICCLEQVHNVLLENVPILR
ncbi:hypothetical protein SAMN04490220_8933 [Rhodococcus jostii]|uniref:Uncharacterized protein n=1 Tax=Rhodococcus jostii TaxID=132919 RepID=A0A1H5MH22_RHOJO|nr:hypothetical protein SAMN04490220_8933 [Rhodococcus jostii]